MGPAINIMNGSGLTNKERHEDLPLHGDKVMLYYHDLRLKAFMGAIDPWKLNAKQKHLGCKKGEANQKQQLSDYKSIHSYTCD